MKNHCQAWIRHAKEQDDHSALSSYATIHQMGHNLYQCLAHLSSKCPAYNDQGV